MTTNLRDNGEAGGGRVADTWQCAFGDNAGTGVVLINYYPAGTKDPAAMLAESVGNYGGFEVESVQWPYSAGVLDGSFGFGPNLTAELEGAADWRFEAAAISGDGFILMGGSPSTSLESPTRESVQEAAASFFKFVGENPPPPQIG